MASLDDRPHALYRFYDQADVLLYVGITLNPGSRWANHREEKAWWHDVATIRTVQYASRAEAIDAEREAIKNEKPLHNVVHNRDRRPVISGAPGQCKVTWICDECGEKVSGVSGWVHVDMGKVARHEAGMAEWRERYPAGEVMPMAALWEMPERPQWQVHHNKCDPAPDRGDYGFEVASIDTHWKVIDWAAHMFGKSWTQHTEWGDLLYRTIGGSFLTQTGDSK